MGVVKLSRTTLWLGIAVGTLGAAGCGSSGGDEGNGSTGTGTPAPTKHLLVDANRDGYINDADGAIDQSVWNKQSGAAFLANLDDDDKDKARDADDDKINGEADSYDLARIVVKGGPDVAAGTAGQITLSAQCGAMPCDPTKFVRVFRLAADGKSGTAEATATILVSATESHAGVSFGIEGKTFLGLPDAELDPGNKDMSKRGAWDGFVDVTYVVGAITEKARMRVSPWMMFGNLTPHLDTVFAGSNYGATESTPFLAGLTQGTTAAQIALRKVPVNEWDDQWTEDYFQTGVTSVPWGADTGGKPQVVGMRVAMPRPFGQGPGPLLPVNFLKKSHLGPDTGYMVVYRCPNGCGQTYDSHGNHDLLPAYTNGASSYPMGRIIHGSNILPETHNFYEAQLAQAPVLKVVTDWLNVGHVDEALSYVAASTPRGWKLLAGSPKLAKQMLTDWQKQGFGQTKMFVGKYWLDASNKETPADITIDDVLADVDLMSASDKAQTHIDDMVNLVKSEVGLADEDVIPMPTLFEDVGGGHALAYTPGTVNLRSFGGTYVVIPDPFGPQINGKDGFKQDILDRLGTATNKLGADGKGLKIYFTDDWNLYHRLEGEVHCGSNQEGPPQVEWKWWERVTP